MKRYGKFLPGLLAALFAYLLFSLGVFGDPENFFEDLLFSPRPIDSRIVVVAIDNESLLKLGQWPWKREHFARFFDVLKENPPKAVGLDVLFGETSRHGPSDDATLASALRETSFPVVLPMEADPLLLSRGVPRSQRTVATKNEFLSSSTRLGYVNLIPDRDGVVRKAPLGVISEEGVLSPIFASLVLGEKPAEGLRRIVFAGRPESVQSVPFWKVLEDPATQKSLAGKYVFIGATAPDLHDEKLTAFSRGVPMSGVEIHAHIANMILLGYSLETPSEGLIALWIFFAAFIPSIIFFFVRSTSRALMLSILTGFIHLPLAIFLFESGVVPNILHVQLSWIVGVAGSFSYRHFVSEREKREIQKLFSKYVSKDVMTELLKNPSQVKLGGEEKIATVFFSDVRGFTTLSEKLTPTELTQFLNRYFTVMTNIALSHKGVVDKYIGDAIMAFWGAPVDNPRHTLDAIDASLQMVDALHAFNAESLREGGLSIDIGIGLNSGEVVAGNMGSDQRFDYTVMGDTVNLASRLEGQTKNYGVHIVTSEFTVAMLDAEEVKKAGVLIREIDQVRVKGKTKPVRIYEIVENARKEFVQKSLSDFDALRTAYYEGKWNEVILHARAIESRGPDGPTSVLRARAEHFSHEPPQAWEGVYDLKTK